MSNIYNQICSMSRKNKRMHKLSKTLHKHKDKTKEEKTVNKIDHLDNEKLKVLVTPVYTLKEQKLNTKANSEVSEESHIHISVQQKSTLSIIFFCIELHAVRESASCLIHTKI